MCVAGRSLAVVLGVFLLTGPSAVGQLQVGEPDEHGFVALQPEEISPEVRDELTRVYIVGHPDEPGIYVYRNRFAPGGSSRPHFHSQDRHITVIEGTWWVALGPDAAVYDPDKMVPMKGMCANLSWKLKRLQTPWFDGIGRNNIKPVRERSRDEESVTFGKETQEVACAG